MNKLMKTMVAGLLGCAWTVCAAPVVLPEATERVPYGAFLEPESARWSFDTASYSSYTVSDTTFKEEGVAQGWSEPYGEWPLDLPFDFPFYGKTYRRVVVSCDGVIRFASGYGLHSSPLQDLFRQIPTIAVLGADAIAQDIYILKEEHRVVIRWKTGLFSLNHFSVSLESTGAIRMAYGPGNEAGGLIGVSAGGGDRFVLSEKSGGKEMGDAADILFLPGAGFPPLLELSPDGRLTGIPLSRGDYSFALMRETGEGAVVPQAFSLKVRPNGNARPVIDSTSHPEGDLTLGAETNLALSVVAHDPEGRPLAYRWFLDDQEVASGPSFTYRRRQDDSAFHDLRCEVSDDFWTDGVVRATWKIGVFALDVSDDVTIHRGMDAMAEARVISSEPASITWFDEDGLRLGEGPRLEIVSPCQSMLVHAIVSTPTSGEVRSRRIHVTVLPGPAVGLVYKLTGPVLEGNRLVLRAKGFGEEPLSYTWKRDGVPVGVAEGRLEIPAVRPGDFGRYTLTVANRHGSATSEPCLVGAARGGALVQWGDSDCGQTLPPAGLTDVVETASGQDFTLALTRDGMVSAWGFEGDRGCDLPDGLSGVNSLAAGGYEAGGGLTARRSAASAAAVLNDGRLLAWGKSYNDQQGLNENLQWVTEREGFDISAVPPEATDVVQVAIGKNCAMALTSRGKVVLWGHPDASRFQELQRVPDGVHDIVEVATHGWLCMALRADGRVFCWGDAVGAVPFMPISTGRPVRSIAVCGGACLALKGDGTVSAWNPSGAAPNVPIAASAEALSDVEALAAGPFCHMALSGDGVVSVGPGGAAAGWDVDPEGPSGDDVTHVPVFAQGAFAIDMGAGHATAIVPDGDGDGVGDLKERYLGRDPLVPEDPRLVEVVGRVCSRGRPLAGARVSLHVASETSRWENASLVTTDTNGVYRFHDILPAQGYQMHVSADRHVDIWHRRSVSREGAAGVSIPWKEGGIIPGPDFDLLPGQSEAKGKVVAVGYDPATGSRPEVALPADATLYLDGLPVSMDPDGAFLYGEVRDSGDPLQGEHLVSVRLPGAAPFIPAPVWRPGLDGGCQVAVLPVDGPRGAIRIETEPAGAEVFVDYSDRPLGVTPLVVGELEAAGKPHLILLRKDGYLRPRPIWAETAEGMTNVVHVPLAADTTNASPLSAFVSSDPAELDIYLDYLPAGRKTPSEVGKMDRANHSGAGWTTVPHTILLRGKGTPSLVARDIPEPKDNAPKVEIIVPEIVIMNEGATSTTPVPVPYAWLDQYGIVSGGDYEAAAHANGANDRPVWESYVAGLDPTDPLSRLWAFIDMVDGAPVVSWRPDLGEKRLYTVLGKRRLSDPEWLPRRPEHHFFKVLVELP